ncbi:MAG: cell division protein FtsZ [Patescibacteria group bacterium]|nr:cell division protein FtsZ [Patescibacteria group bacterium]
MPDEIKQNFELPKFADNEPINVARIKVIGVGGGGNSAVNRMVNARIRGVEFITINTDLQALATSAASIKVQIGKETTGGLGSGADPTKGRESMEENKEEVYEVLKNSDMVFVTAGMGGGTGSGAGPVVAAIARELGALTVGVVTKPFTFEGSRRREVADKAIEELKDNVDTLIVIPNDKLLQVIDKKTTMLDAFSVVDDVLRQGIQGISDLITIPGIINVDFADVKTIMQDAGSALMGIGRAKGENRAIEAARAAIDSPLLDLSIEGAKGILFNITGGPDMSMYEIDEAAKTITEAAHPEANIIFGAMVDEAMQGEIKITVIATGFGDERPKRRDEAKQGFTLTSLAEIGNDDNEKEEEPVMQQEPFVRKPELKEEPEEDLEPGEGSSQEDNYEIPAFIRRKLK